MSGSCKKAKRNREKASNVAYNAQGRDLRNAKRRAARQQKIEAAHAFKAVAVTAKRKRGAVARLERRIAAGVKGLEATLAKARAALKAAEAN